MPWQMRYVAEHHTIEGEIIGQITAAELFEGVAESLREGNARGTARYLCDTSAMTGGHSIFDLHALAERLHELGMPLGAREALIIPDQPMQALDPSFWETLTRNRGFEVRSFLDRESALAWLLRGEESRTGT